MKALTAPEKLVLMREAAKGCALFAAMSMLAMEGMSADSAGRTRRLIVVRIRTEWGRITSIMYCIEVHVTQTISRQT